MSFTTITVEVDSEVLEKYTKLARDTDRKRDALINQALEESIDHIDYVTRIWKTVEDCRSGKQKTYTAEEVLEHLAEKSD